MLKNLELTIFNKENIFHAEPFSLEFHSVGYYCFLKLTKIKIPHATYIKIGIFNSSQKREISFDISNGVLYISLDLNFSNYLKLSTTKKIRFQCEMMYDILESTFIKYDINRNVLDAMTEELQANKWELQIVLLKKKVLKKYFYTFKLLLEIDSFTYICIIEEGKSKKEIILFKSVALYFSMLLFKKIKIINNKEILIGNDQTPFFKIDIATKSFCIIEENKSMINPDLFCTIQ